MAEEAVVRIVRQGRGRKERHEQHADKHG
jgi:hypothetical protein